MSDTELQLFRTHGDSIRKLKQNFKDGFKNTEWNETDSRIDENAWIERYQYESGILADIIKNHNLTKVLEFGSGPGKMADMIQDKVGYDVSYTMIDKPNAKRRFDERGYKGKFIVRDLSSLIDTSGLDDNYDFIITNDFLEHIPNPSYLLKEAYKHTTSDARLFVSVPNWRMGHSFIYRGLFDYDNILYFLWSHGWSAEQVSGSPLKCKPSPKLTSEINLPDSLIDSWNWYFECSKILD